MRTLALAWLASCLVVVGPQAVRAQDDAAAQQELQALKAELDALEAEAGKVAPGDKAATVNVARSLNGLFNKLYACKHKSRAEWKPLLVRAGEVDDRLIETGTGKKPDPAVVDDPTREALAELDQVAKDQAAQPPNDRAAQNNLTRALNGARSKLTAASPRARRTQEWIDALARLDDLRARIQARGKGEPDPAPAQPQPPTAAEPAKPEPAKPEPAKPEPAKPAPAPAASAEFKLVEGERPPRDPALKGKMPDYGVYEHLDKAAKKLQEALPKVQAYGENAWDLKPLHEHVDRLVKGAEKYGTERSDVQWVQRWAAAYRARVEAFEAEVEKLRREKVGAATAAAGDIKLVKGERPPADPSLKTRLAEYQVYEPMDKAAVALAEALPRAADWAAKGWNLDDLRSPANRIEAAIAGQKPDRSDVQWVQRWLVAYRAKVEAFAVEVRKLRGEVEPGADVPGERWDPDEFQARAGLGGLVFATEATSKGSYSIGWEPVAARGAPDVFPRYGDFKGAWGPVDAQPTLELTFPPTLTRAIYVFETDLPGAVEVIVDGEMNVLYRTSAPAGKYLTAQVLVALLPEPRTISSLKLILSRARVPGAPMIDAVGLGPEAPRPFSGERQKQLDLDDAAAVEARLKEVRARFSPDTFQGGLGQDASEEQALAWVERCKKYLEDAPRDEVFLRAVMRYTPRGKDRQFADYYNWFTTEVYLAKNTKEYGLPRGLAYARNAWAKQVKETKERYAALQPDVADYWYKFRDHIARIRAALLAARGLARQAELLGEGDVAACRADVEHFAALARKFEEEHVAAVKAARMPKPFVRDAEAERAAREIFKGARGHRVGGAPEVLKKQRTVGNQVEERKYHKLEITLAVEVEGKWYIKYGSIGRPLYYDSEKPAGPWEFWQQPDAEPMEILPENIDELP